MFTKTALAQSRWFIPCIAEAPLYKAGVMYKGMLMYRAGALVQSKCHARRKCPSTERVPPERGAERFGSRASREWDCSIDSTQNHLPYAGRSTLTLPSLPHTASPLTLLLPLHLRLCYHTSPTTSHYIYTLIQLLLLSRCQLLHRLIQTSQTHCLSVYILPAILTLTFLPHRLYPHTDSVLELGLCLSLLLFNYLFSSSVARVSPFLLFRMANLFSLLLLRVCVFVFVCGDMVCVCSLAFV